MTPFQLSEFKSLAEKTTKNEWSQYNLRRCFDASIPFTHEDSINNYNFIAYCKTHADAIISRIEKLEKALQTIASRKSGGVWSVEMECIHIARKALERGE